MDTASYTLNKAAGGTGHYAHVEVALTTAGEGMSKGGARFSDRYKPHEDCLPSWENAALLGASAMMDRLNCRLQISILSLNGSFSDTLDDDAWVASAIATWRLLKKGAQDPKALFFNGRWAIHFDDATISPKGTT